MVYKYEWSHSKGYGDGTLDLPSEEAVIKRVKATFPADVEDIKITVTPVGGNQDEPATT